jgi:hypothetical protein
MKFFRIPIFEYCAYALHAAGLRDDGEREVENIKVTKRGRLLLNEFSTDFVAT